MKKVQFGTAAAIIGKTPTWATYTFRTIIILTTAVSIWVAQTQLLQESAKFEIVLIFKMLDSLAWGLSRMLGIVEK